MPRAAERQMSAVDEADLDDELLTDLRGRYRRYRNDGRTYGVPGHDYLILPRELAITLRGNRLVEVPGHSDPFGLSSHFARTTGVFAGWSAEKRGGRLRRFPVIRLRTDRYTVVDIDAQNFSDAIIPPNALAVFESQRGILVALPGKPRTWYNHPIWSLQDPNYVIRSQKRGTWNVRVYDKGERGPGRTVTQPPPQTSQQAKESSDIISTWLHLGGRWKAPGGKVWGGKK